MKITPDQLIHNLSASGLMTADEAGSLCEGMPTLSGPTESATVVQELVGTGKLTEYQAECVCQGDTTGLVFDEYLVLDKIGQGGMGVVLKAQHRRMNRIVAVKKLPTAALESEDAIKRFYREVEAAARLMHPNVVAALDAREHDGVHYLVMEYVEGQDLAEILKERGPLPVEEAVGYVVQAAQGLEYAHSESVFHRDIKPANLLLDKKGTIKILDMGLARIATEAGAGDAPDQLTTSGQVMGTCDYMAPEQAEDTHSVDHRADIYSLGCTLYRLLTGEPMYSGTTLMKVLLSHREAAIPSLAEKRPDIPATVDAVFQKMVAKQPDDRYASMAEVVEALQAALGRGPAPIVTPEPDSGLVNFLDQIRDKPSIVTPTGRGSRKTVGGIATAKRKAKQKTAPAIEETIDLAAQADTDPKTLTQIPAAEATPPEPRMSAKRRKQTQMLLLVGAGVGLSLIGAVVVAAVLYVQTNYGTVVVQTEDKDVEVLVKRGGEVVDIIDAKDKWRVEVKSGGYRVELKGGNDQFALDKDTITVSRGGEVRVRVEVKPRPKPPRPAIAPFDTAQAKKHQEEWADYLGLPVEQEFELPGGEKLTMDLIPPGEFLMGSTAEEQAPFLEEAKAANDTGAIDGILSEGPQHPVQITRPFYLGKYEVTQAQWESVMGNNPSLNKDKPSHPVEAVSWDDIQPFLGKLNAAGTLRLPAGKSTLGEERLEFALPTEAQWEYTCRAGTTTFWHDGDTEDCLQASGWYKANSGGKTHPVGQLKANAWGLYDMRGNVWEWCADWHGGDYYRQSPTNDPSGPPTGSDRVGRGGSWFNRARRCRSADRLNGSPGYREFNLGLRLACNIQYGPETKPALPAVSSSKPPAERPAATGPDGESPPTGVDAAAPSTASLDDLPPWQLPPDAPDPAIAPFDIDKAKEHQQAWADYLKLPVEGNFDLPGGEKLTMMLIPPGEFLMGSTAEEQARFLEEAKAANDTGAIERIPTEGPQHRVRITRPFFLGKYEVTQAQWESVMGDNPSKFKDVPSHPLEQVSWEDIQPFLEKLNAAGTLRLPAGRSTLAGERLEFALPTEAQWEHACRAGTTTFWHDGDTEASLRESGWYKANSGGKTHPVGQLKASAWGLYDMHGNVSEWCADWYGADYYQQSPLTDPSGPPTGSNRVLRGGRWSIQAWYCRSAFRYYDSPGFRNYYLGLRLALVLADK